MSQSITHHDLPQVDARPGIRNPFTAGWRLIRRFAPPVLAVGMLGGIAYWGHANDWALPKFSALVGGQAAAETPWCEEHGVSEAECMECNPSLHPAEKDFGWCDVHGVAQCPFEHPEIVESLEPTTLSDRDRATVASALALRPRAENNSRCQTHLRRVQFASHEAAEKSGVDITLVERAPVTEAIAANGEVRYDETRLAHLSSRVPGSAWLVRKQVGEVVHKGDVLALIDSADVGAAKAELLQAIAHERLTSANLKRLSPLAESGAIAGRQILEATSAQHEAHIRLNGARQALVNLGFVIPEQGYADATVEDITRGLQFLGIPEDITSTLDPASSTSNLFPLRASLDGEVVERNVVAGEVIDTTTSLFTIGDVAQMWLVLDVRQDDIDFVRLGAPVRFRPSDRPDSPEVTGKISWISTAADNRTRTVKVRVDLPNDGSLRANTFGTGRIVLRKQDDAVVIPSAAVHWDGCCQVVFVRDRHYFDADSPKFYHVRKVRLGVKETDHVEILAGLVPGEVIASKGSSVLAAQLLRSNLGAGCGCAH